MKMNTLIILLLLFSSTFLFVSVKSFYQLYKLDLLGGNFWRESGVKNIFFMIVLIMLFISGLALLLEKNWAISFTKTTFGLFWIAAVFSWLYQMVGAIQLSRKKNDIQFSDLLDASPYTKEMLEKSLKPFNKFTQDGDEATDFFDSMMEESSVGFAEDLESETRKMVIGKTIGFVVLTALLYLGWITL